MGGRRWTMGEDALLRARWLIDSPPGLAAALGRTPLACARRGEVLGLRGRPPAAPPEGWEDMVVAAYIAGAPLADCARRAGVRHWRARACIAGQRRAAVWNPVRDHVLVSGLRAGRLPEVVADDLAVSVQALIHRARALGVLAMDLADTATPARSVTHAGVAVVDAHLAALGIALTPLDEAAGRALAAAIAVRQGEDPRSRCGWRGGARQVVEAACGAPVVPGTGWCAEHGRRVYRARAVDMESAG